MDTRHRVRLKVQLNGVDAVGQPYKQTVFTHDVSVRGARLEDTPPVVEPASVVWVEHRGRKARFRVVWVGGFANNEIGLQSLDPTKCIWGNPLPGQPVYSRPPVEA